MITNVILSHFYIYSTLDCLHIFEHYKVSTLPTYYKIAFKVLQRKNKCGLTELLKGKALQKYRLLSLSYKSLSKTFLKIWPKNFFKRLSCSTSPTSDYSSNWHSSGIIHFLYCHFISIEVCHVYFYCFWCGLSSQIKLKLLENQYILPVNLRLHMGMKQ